MSNVNIHQVVENGSYELFKYLIESDVNLIDSVEDYYGRTPLIICAYKNTEVHNRIARHLLDCGCDVNTQGNYKWSNWNAIMTAVYYENKTMVEMLINANANLDLIDIGSNTVLQIALDICNKEIIELLLSEMETKRIDERLKLEKSLQDAVFNNDFDETVNCIRIIAPENLKQVINTTTSGNHTLLYRACRNGNPQIVDLLLENGAIARPHYYTKYSPLYIACHMGNIEIAQMILQKFPHLIQVNTIEKFLPFHAVCSQGHLEILKLLVTFKPASKVGGGEKVILYDKIYQSGSGDKYQHSFDLNAVDVNEQSGLYAAVQANRYQVCEYLLSLRFKKLSEKEVLRHDELVKKHNAQIPTENSSFFNLSSILSSATQPQNQQQQPSTSFSFFSHLKSALLDNTSATKPNFDSYAVNYSKTGTNSTFHDNHHDTQFDHEAIIEEEEDEPDSDQQFFNPISLNKYSKFGTTCLHEAIKNRNLSLVQLLLAKGANVNSPIYETQVQPMTGMIADAVASNANTAASAATKIISNSLCEALKNQDEPMFVYLVDWFQFDQDKYNQTFRICLDLLAASTNVVAKTFYKKVVAYLIKFKIINDSEFKVNLKNKLSAKLINYLDSTEDDKSTIDSGTILNWFDLDTKLDKLYESWLLNSVKYYKFKLKMNMGAMSAREDSGLSPREDSNLIINAKKLHLHAITRVDLSNNKLEQLPFALFQIESLRYLKLSGNQLQKLPTGKNKELDDINILLINNENLYWSCNQLEEIELDNNRLVELPPQIFLIKSLKHLNVSNNYLEALPVEMWQAPTLFDLNACHNKLTRLPIVNCEYFFYKENVNKNSRSRAFTSPASMNSTPPSTNTSGRMNRRDEARSSKRQLSVTHDHPLLSSGRSEKSMTHSTSNNLIAGFKEKPVFKANIWHMHSVNTAVAGSASSYMLQSLDNDESYDDSSVNSSSGGLRLTNKQIGLMSRRESKLIELNLSNNQFARIPDCLSCLAPKLIKLNLSYNKIESMGAVCDLPAGIKFLDLSNNSIKRPMHLLNENLLKFILFYYSKYTEQPLGDEFLNNTFISLLLENDFCYQSIILKSLNKNLLLDQHMMMGLKGSPRNQVNVGSIATPMYLISDPRPPTASDNSRSMSKQRLPHNQANLLSTPTNTQAASRRRTRSQSRSARTLLTTPPTPSAQPSPTSNPATSSPNSYSTPTSTHQGRPVQRRLLPFDLFLVNLKYNQTYAQSGLMTGLSRQQLVDMIYADMLQMWHQIDSERFEHKERVVINSQNLQVFLEQLCVHKRHIKLENLKSINLSQNRLKKFKFMIDLAPSQCSVEDLERLNTTLPKVKKESQTNYLIKLAINNVETETTSSTAEDDSDLSDESFSSSEENDVNQLDDDSSFIDRKSKKISLKAKLGLGSVSPIKKKPPPSQGLSPRRKLVDKNEEKAQAVAKLIYPNLTHLDVSSNRLERLPGSLAFIENLSYINASSNLNLFRVSPKLGLLGKLWNFDLKNSINIKEPIMLDSLVKQRTKTSDILGYLKSILEDSRPYARVKLMFVGVQAIGKTTLLNKLREEGVSTTSARKQQTWSERSINSSNSSHNSVNISTVGIDINEWIYEKPRQKSNSTSSSNLGGSSAIAGMTPNMSQFLYIYQMDSGSQNKNLGPITFRTWDFAGQKEYYTTHQYFISKRALYLVCWKLTEEEKGINEIHQWLSNIQTRAPGSPCIIVGTHQDQLAKLKNYKEISNYLQRCIYERFVQPNTESSETTSAYPPILASIEISSKTGHNIKLLARLVYDVAAQMKVSGMKDQLLLEQKIPVTYLALEECIGFVVNKLKMQSRNPVLNTNDYLKEIRHAVSVLYPDENEEEKAAAAFAINLNEMIRGPKRKDKLLLIRFRDDAEILQATQFLHENGILIHYNDVALNDLFFLDPQWLCDILATVVTIREINPFAAKGVMKIKDLQVLFKGSRFNEGDEIMSFIVDLLGKFELALTWDNQHLLIPSLLPSEHMLKFSNQDIRIAILSKEKVQNKRLELISFNNLAALPTINTPNVSSPTSKKQADQWSNLYSNVKLANSFTQMTLASKVNMEFLYESKIYKRKELKDEQNSIRRLYCLNYLPSGFFSRLITRILCDNIVKESLSELVDIDYSASIMENCDLDSKQLDSLIEFVCQEAEWKCWQTGIELKYLDYTFFRIKECLNNSLVDVNPEQSDTEANDSSIRSSVLFRDCENEFKLKTPQRQQCSFVECYASFLDYKIVKCKQSSVHTSATVASGLTLSQAPFKQPHLGVSRQKSIEEFVPDTTTHNDTIEDQPSDEKDILIKILCNRQISLKLFALIIEIMDNLLEDWYPDLGTRFMQDSKGDYLVTRLAPCINCIQMPSSGSRRSSSQSKRSLSKTLSNNLTSNSSNLFIDPFSISASESVQDNLLSADNIKTKKDEEDCFEFTVQDEEKLKTLDGIDWTYCFMLDDICYSVMKNSQLVCPRHGKQTAHSIAPDLAFEDIDPNFLIENDSMKLDALLGRGSFGSVFAGSLTFRETNGNESHVNVAVKVLENLSTVNSTALMLADEVEKLNENKPNNKNASKKSRESLNKYWNHRKSIRQAAKAYTVARQEIAIISSLKHEHIVSMIGLSIKPLAIVLELAPLGNLKDLLNEYKSSMCKLPASVIQQVCVQVCSALVYLHTNRIIYRDLKADNVLVWRFPSVNGPPNSSTSVHIKLADYSISRCVLPTGTKGFAGTPGFIAPEILKYNGEETYSEKVDCFSFAMLLYELITLKHPFEGQEQIKDIVLNGGRPLIKSQDLLYPTLMLDLMCLCWQDNPRERPSSSEILKYAKSFEFGRLLDVTVLEDYEQLPLFVTCLNQEQDDEIEELDEQARLDFESSQEKQLLLNKSRQMMLDPTSGHRVANDPARTTSLDADELDDEDDQEEIEEDDVVDMWIARNNLEEGTSQLEILTYQNKLNCTNRKLINVCNEKIEVICVYNGNQIWLVDSLKFVYIFCAKTYRKLYQYVLDLNSTTGLVSMFSLPDQRQILICASSGKIMLLQVDLFHNLSLKGNQIDDSFMLNDEFSYCTYDLSIKINTSVLLPSRYDKNCDLWLGSDNAEIFSFSLKSRTLTGSYLHTSSHHYITNSVLGNSGARRNSIVLGDLSSEYSAANSESEDNKNLNVTLIKTTDVDTFFLWSYVYPGSTVYLWNHVSKKIMSAYNCRRAFDELNFKTNPIKDFKVVDMTFVNGHLYCGLSNGLVLALKRLTLTPIQVFSAHMHHLHSMCSLTFETRVTTVSKDANCLTSGIRRQAPGDSISPPSSNTTSSVVKRTHSTLVTLGRALAPVHEDIYLSSAKYRSIEALQKYANCLILCSWNCGISE